MSDKIVPVFYKNRYYNSAKKDKPESLLFGTFPSFLRSLFHRWQYVSPSMNEWVTKPEIISHTIEPRITWLGHSSFLIQMHGINIMTDPVFGNVTPLFKRLLPFPVEPHLLPPIDYVLISHNHRDHCDKASLLLLKKNNRKIQILCPKGDKAWYVRQGFKYVNEYAWYELCITKKITFTFMPAVHWSQRGIFDKNKSLWGSWLITAKDCSIYFAGDSAWGDHFAQIAHDVSRIDYALLPIGPCEPHEWMKHTHIDAQQAVDAFIALGAHHCIPMHWGTFPFGNDQFEDPLVRLKAAWHKSYDQLRYKTLHIMKVGQTIIGIPPIAVPHVSTQMPRMVE